MPLLDVRRVYVVQDRETGSFVDINMGFVRSFRNAARAESAELARESMNFAMYDNQIECLSGYDVHAILEPVNEHENWG